MTNTPLNIPRWMAQHNRAVRRKRFLKLVTRHAENFVLASAVVFVVTMLMIVVAA